MYLEYIVEGVEMFDNSFLFYFGAESGGNVINKATFIHFLL